MTDHPPLNREAINLEEVPFQGIVEAALAGVYVVLDERFRYVNKTFAHMFGYQPEEVDGMHLRELVVLEAGDDVMEKYRQRISGETPSIRYTTQCRHKLGGIVHLEVHGARVTFRGKPALSGMVVDITERVEQQRDLAQSREQLRKLTHFINQAREDQRAAFAREVHDVLGGMLSSIKMDVARIVRRANAANDVAIQGIGSDLLTLTQETIDAARRIADEARPSVFDSSGLFPALEDMLLKFGARAGVNVRFHMATTGVPLGGQRDMHCYRIVQEALTNVARHAKARHVQLDILPCKAGFELRLSDDGIGMALEAADRPGMGLISMRERAREIGGQLDIQSSPSNGTLLVLVAPWSDPAPGHLND